MIENSYIRTFCITSLLSGLLVMNGCATNPVTGKSELRLVSQTEEIKIGQKSYLPTRQSQGGEYRLDPELTRYVNEVGQKLARVSDRSDLPYEFVVLNNSVPNAWALPGGKIAINRGLLLELGSEAELAAVLGHEIVHAAARHGARSMERGMLLQLGIMAASVATAGEKHADLMMGAAVIGSQLANTRYGRNAELESDRYGMKYMARAGYNPQEAVTLQQTFVRLSKMRETNWLEGLFASHPPSQERVDANRKYAATLPKGLKTGRQEYLQHIATLKSTQQAYADYDAGRKALSEGDAGRALTLARKAIRQENREALYYGLQGEALLKMGNPGQAKSLFDEAIRRNDAYFAFYLQRGLARQKMADQAGARQDLELSVKLLPTAIAHYTLGTMALNAHNEESAITHYRAAAASGSPLGQQAAISLATLELPRNPDKYISAHGKPDNKGRLFVQVRNRAPIAVSRVVLGIQYRTGEMDKVPVRDTIPAGKTVTLRLPNPGDKVQHIKVVRAAPAQ